MVKIRVDLGRVRCRRRALVPSSPTACHFQGTALDKIPLAAHNSDKVAALEPQHSADSRSQLLGLRVLGVERKRDRSGPREDLVVLAKVLLTV